MNQRDLWDVYRPHRHMTMLSAKFTNVTLFRPDNALRTLSRPTTVPLLVDGTYLQKLANISKRRLIGWIGTD